MGWIAFDKNWKQSNWGNLMQTEAEKSNHKALWLLGSMAGGLFADAESTKQFENSVGLLSNRWLVWR